MPTTQLLILCITLLLVVAIIASSRDSKTSTAEPSPFDDLHVGDRVAVYTEGGQSVTGVVSKTPSSYLTLGNAGLVSSGSTVSLGNARVPSCHAQLVQVIERSTDIAES